MAKTFTLDDIRDHLENEYAGTEFDLGDHGKVSLANPLRLTSVQRSELSALLEQFNKATDDENKDDDKDENKDEEPADVDERIAEMISSLRATLAVACSEADLARLDAVVEGEPEGDRVLIWRFFLENWMGRGRAGEASASQS